jgi:hypothetical protein
MHLIEYGEEGAYARRATKCHAYFGLPEAAAPAVAAVVVSEPLSSLGLNGVAARPLPRGGSGSGSMKWTRDRALARTPGAPPRPTT